MIKAQITGAANIHRTLRGFEGRVRERILGDEVDTGAEDFRSTAEQRAPRDTGQLAGDIQVDSKRSPDSADARIGPSPDSPHGAYQEYGTRRHPAQPFMRPAYDSRKRAVRAKFSRGVKREVNRTRG